jgi:hypothetical protein
MSHRLTRTTGLALTIAALAAQPAAAMPIDPPIRDYSPAATSQSLVSADARDAARTAGVTSAPAQDLRSPDARDAAAGRGTFSAPDVTVVKLTEPESAPVSGGLDWGDAGIGAAGVFAIMLLALASAAAIMHRKTALAGASRGWRRGVGL